MKTHCAFPPKTDLAHRIKSKSLLCTRGVHETSINRRGLYWFSSVLGSIFVSFSCLPRRARDVTAEGAADGAGLGNKFLANIRECDALVHVVRCFEDEDVIHVDGKVDPLTDISVINFELALADMAQIERRLERLGKGRAKSNAEKEAEQGERDVLAKLTEYLDTGKPARLCDLNEDEWALVKDLMLLTAKPCIYAANVNEDDLADNGASNDFVAKVRQHAEEEGSSVTIISAQVESELIKLDPQVRGLGFAWVHVMGCDTFFYQDKNRKNRTEPE